VSTTLEIAPTAAGRPSASRPLALARAGLVAGHGHAQGAPSTATLCRTRIPLGAFPFETLQRRDTPTTFIDHDRVPRFPKRADFFARALFGDLGKSVQDAPRTRTT
jgi:hypothetical protein